MPRPKGSKNKSTDTAVDNMSSSSSSSSTAPPAPKSPKPSKSATFFSTFDRSVDGASLARSKSHEFLEMLAPQPSAEQLAPPPPAAAEEEPPQQPLNEPLNEEQRGFMQSLFGHLLPPAGEPKVPLNDVSFMPPPQPEQPPPPPKPPAPPKTAPPMKLVETDDVMKQKGMLDYKIRSWLRICPHLRGQVQVPDPRSDLSTFEFALQECKRRCMGMGMEQTVARQILKVSCGLFEEHALPMLQQLSAPSWQPLLNGRFFALDVAHLVDAQEQNELQMAVDCCAIDLADYLGGGGPWMMLAQAVFKTFTSRVAQNNERMMQQAAMAGVNAAAASMPQSTRDRYADL